MPTTLNKSSFRSPLPSVPVDPRLQPTNESADFPLTMRVTLLFLLAAATLLKAQDIQPLTQRIQDLRRTQPENRALARQFLRDRSTALSALMRTRPQEALGAALSPAAAADLVAWLPEAAAAV